jgi:hypothetical protein
MGPIREMTLCRFHADTPSTRQVLSCSYSSRVCLVEGLANPGALRPRAEQPGSAAKTKLLAAVIHTTMHQPSCGVKARCGIGLHGHRSHNRRLCSPDEITKVITCRKGCKNLLAKRRGFGSFDYGQIVGQQFRASCEQHFL